MVNFGIVLDKLKLHHDVAFTRKGWNNRHIIVKLQRPDENSFMTEPYIYMEKSINGELKRFPLDLSCESILAEDWEVTEGEIILN